MGPRLIWGREPVLFFAMLSTFLQACTLPFDLRPDLQGAVNAGLLALGGLLTAVKLGGADGVLPALLGLLKATFAVVISSGVHLQSTTQVAVLAIVTAAGAFFVRDRVTAPVPGSMSPPQAIDLPVRHQL